VENELQRAREDAARYEDVDEPAQDGDRVLVTVAMSLDGEEIAEAGIDKPTWLQVGTNLAEFDEGLKGLTAGEEKTFTFTYPEDFALEERRGKQAEARVSCAKVQRRILPELDDAFAASLGHENVETLRRVARERLEERAASLADSELDSEILREVVRNASVHFPDEMATQEVADDLSAFVQRLERGGITLQQYLDANELDLPRLEADYTERARERIANTLVLMEIARQNDLKVEERDVDEEINRRAAASDTEPAVMRRVFEEQGDLSTLRNQLFYRKVVDFVKAQNTVEEQKA
jgi:trigger factor